uniref:ORF139 n=1 Tax=Cydia pomonella granulosis virus TaxID=28289 RepID=A0A097P1B3_GVCP|nr:ORF139 [Cydia pomonella granulovirus]AIU36922.1 ORF139 [Cydia pomonella granulovirus]QDW81198.1 ORF139 [Cydia pomonella granulovirus]QGY99507.1 ORF139 [Cydia pomonella granulovirus]QGY99931.1 ORF139 [Cydia pomonella granulovirus]
MAASHNISKALAPNHKLFLLLIFLLSATPLLLLFLFSFSMVIVVGLYTSSFLYKILDIITPCISACGVLRLRCGKKVRFKTVDENGPFAQLLLSFGCVLNQHGVVA